jgi:hypothetical protein
MKAKGKAPPPSGDLFWGTDFETVSAHFYFFLRVTARIARML